MVRGSSLHFNQRSGYKICPQQSRRGQNADRGVSLQHCSLQSSSNIPIARTGKKYLNRRKRKSTVEGERFEKTLRVCQRKEGCAALNHKSSRLCQISSTLQALKRNKEALLFAFPFSEGDRKLKGAQINLKGEQSTGWCGAGSGAGAAGPLGADAGRGSRRLAVRPSSLRTAPRPRAQAEVRRGGGLTGPRSTSGAPQRPGQPSLPAGVARAPERRGPRLECLRERGGHGANQPSEPRAERWPGGVERTRPPPPWTAGRGAAPEERTRAGQRRASAPAGIVCGPRPLPRAARPSPSAAAARAFVHARPAHRRAACRTDDGDADTHRPAAEGRVLLIHFPLALARPGRRGRGPAGGNGRSAPGTVRAARCTVRSARGGQGSGGDPDLPTSPRDRRTD